MAVSFLEEILDEAILNRSFKTGPALPCRRSAGGARAEQSARAGRRDDRDQSLLAAGVGRTVRRRHVSVADRRGSGPRRHLHAAGRHSDQSGHGGARDERQGAAAAGARVAAAAGRAGGAGVHDCARRGAAGAAGGDQRSQAYGGAGAYADSAHLRPVSAVQRRGGRSERTTKWCCRTRTCSRSRSSTARPSTPRDGGVFGADAGDQGNRHASRAQLRALHRPEDRQHLFAQQRHRAQHDGVGPQREGECRADLEAADTDGVLRPGGGRGARGAADHGAARTGGGRISEDGTGRRSAQLGDLGRQNGAG